MFCFMFFAQFLSSLVKVIVSLRKLVFVLKGRTVQEGRDGPGPWTPGTRLDGCCYWLGIPFRQSRLSLGSVCLPTHF